ncbi:hypothetical protein ASZ78_015082 [Callipepla squamata]|uniref:Uncharacterized protein n=1 Tax=Callipepla squamata TaxID=9009 RepID=A0A226N4B3_CALSU|nr:hypothetical protein ASZ78_015082 [Callipepla squamata]
MFVKVAEFCPVPVPTVLQSVATHIGGQFNWPESVSRDTIHCLAFDDTTQMKHLAQRRYTYAELLPGKSAAGTVVLKGSRMENMLQSLYLENRAGYYFTHFCEKSGNKVRALSYPMII